MQARSASARSAPESADARARLVAGLLVAVEERGYAASTIADIVGHARVSKRTFYEHFTDKDACFLAAYRAVSDELIAVIARSHDEAAAGAASFEARVVASVGAYLEALEERRALTRTFLLEVHAAGPAALRLRREIHDQFAALLRLLVERARADGAPVAPLTQPMSVALVGGINELVLVALETKARLAPLAETAAALVRAVTATPAPSRG